MTRPLVLLVVVAAITGACKEQATSRAPATGSSSVPVVVDAAAAPEPLAVACNRAPHVERLAEGLTLETLRPETPPAIPTADKCLRVLRADPARYEVVLGTGAERSGPAWADAEDAFGVTNASMFHHGGASTGLLIDGDKVLTAGENGLFGAFFAAGPRTATRPAVTMWGRDCDGDSLAALRRDYRLIVQNYRLLGCSGKPIAWKDEKVYSAAAVGVDRRGRVLFIHSRAPYKMSEFTKMLVEPGLSLDLRAAMYVEGGPEATLAVRAGPRTATFVGSYESHFVENDSNVDAWRLPNVLMLRARTEGPIGTQ